MVNKFTALIQVLMMSALSVTAHERMDATNHNHASSRSGRLQWDDNGDQRVIIPDEQHALLAGYRWSEHNAKCAPGDVCSSRRESPGGPCDGIDRCEYRWDSDCICAVAETHGGSTHAKRVSMPERESCVIGGFCNGCNGAATGRRCDGLLNCEERFDNYCNCEIVMTYPAPVNITDTPTNQTLQARLSNVNRLENVISMGANTLAYGTYEPKWATHSTCYDRCGYDRCDETTRNFNAEYLVNDWIAWPKRSSTIRCVAKGQHYQWKYRDAYCDSAAIGMQVAQEAYTTSSQYDYGNGQVSFFSQTEWKAPDYVSTYTVVYSNGGSYVVEPHSVYCKADRGGTWCDAVCSKSGMWSTRALALWQPWMSAYIGYFNSMICPVAC